MGWLRPCTAAGGMARLERRVRKVLQHVVRSTAPMHYLLACSATASVRVGVSPCSCGVNEESTVVIRCSTLSSRPMPACLPM